MAKKRRTPTFADMLGDPTWSEEQPSDEGLYAVRPGSYNLAGEFFDLNGEVLARATSEVTPRQAKKLVLKGAAVAHEGCGCGGYQGCAPIWASAEELKGFRVASPPTFGKGSAPTWIDVWKSAGATVVFTHGEVVWGDAGLEDRWGSS